VLCAEVSSEKSLSLADVESALSTRDIVRDGVSATVERVVPTKQVMVADSWSRFSRLG